jgi:uncharacterized protein involved in exopolysaccharide biosynthesis
LEDTITSSRGAETSSDVRIFSLAATVLRQARLIVICSVLSAAAVAAYTLVTPRTYTAESSFVPQMRGTPVGGLTTLAAQLGVLPIGAEASEGPAFYVDLATSRQLMARLIDESYTIDERASQVTTDLVDWYQVEGENERLRHERAIDELRQDLSVSVTTQTGVVTLRVTLENPYLAEQVNRRLLGFLNDFNLRSRQTQAGHERQFIEQRLSEVRTSLTDSEDRLAEFLGRNREYATSPELRLQYERLSREISLQQQLFVSLADSYEQARIEEIRNTPVISVVEDPIVPARPDPRFLVLKLVLAGLAGAAFAFVFAMAGEYVRRARNADAAGYDDFRAERARFAVLRNRSVEGE